MKSNITSIVIPVWNEAENIRALVTRVDEAMKSRALPYQIIFVDDRSTDNTRDIIAVLAKAYPVRLFIKKEGHKRGKAESLIAGFKTIPDGIVVILDGDLQYGPEHIPDMVAQVLSGADVVVANRKARHTGLGRRVASSVFRTVFGKLLHGFDVDIQSGLKVFRKEVLDRVRLNPTSPWMFDLDFLVQARSAGFSIASHDITFEKRNAGEAKISVVKAAAEMALGAVKLKLRPPQAIPFDTTLEKKKGKGFHFKGNEYVHHSTLPHTESALLGTGIRGKLFVFVLVALFVIGLFWNLQNTLIIGVALLTILYTIDLLFNAVLILRSLHKSHDIEVSDDQLAQRGKMNWPTYTIFCPLYKEWRVVPQFVEAMNKLDYPKDKLQVMLLLEEDDKESVENIGQMSLPSFFDVVVVPESKPKTKPKALNYGLTFAKGEFCAIYDAEDIPDPLQLKKVVVAFEGLSDKTACIQAKLNFYNPRQNLLTKLFTLEYSLWFDLILPGLQSLDAPIPLGGTSNHFRVSQVKDLNGWDAFNVTEDCDLGMRLAKRGYQTAIVNSTTMEEANSNGLNWYGQRSRWIKGYIQTYMVHMRQLKKFSRSFKKPDAFIFQFIVGGKVLSMIINPFMWLITISYFVFRPIIGEAIESIYPAPVLYLGVFSLIFGNFIYMYAYMVGCLKRDYYDLIKYAFLTPFYWLAMSVATWRAIFEVITKPHYWNKTVHGYHLEKKKSWLAQLFSRPTQVKVTLENPEVVSPKEQPKLTAYSGASMLMVSLVAVNGINFLFNAWLGRQLSFQEFSLIAFISTVVQLVSIPLTALSGTVNFRTSQLIVLHGKEAAYSFYRDIEYKSVVVSGIIAVIWLMLSPFLSTYFQVSQLAVIILVAPVIIFGTLGGVVRGHLTGSLSFGLVGFLVLLEVVTKFGLAWIIEKTGAFSVLYFSIPLSIVIAAYVGFILHRAKHKVVIPVKAYGFPKRFYTASLLTSIASTAFIAFDILLVKHFMSPEIAGQYSILSLVGKMVYFIGTLGNSFIVPYVVRAEAKGSKDKRMFGIFFALNIVLVATAWVLLGVFGKIVVPILFGSKTLVILPYILEYTFGIALFTLTNILVIYHLAKRHFSASVISIGAVALMAYGISAFHSSLGSIVHTIEVTSIIYAAVVALYHGLQKNGQFITRNLVDVVSAFFPLASTGQSSLKKRILIFNWRDTKHSYAGGAEVYLHELAKRWVKEGNAVTLFCGNDGNSKRNEVVDGVNIVRRGGFYTVYLWAILYYIVQFRGRYDVIIDCENGIPFFTPLYAKEKIYCLLFHVHQEVFTKSLSKPFAAFALLLENRALPWVYRKTKFITISNSTKKDMEALGIGTSGIEIVQPGVDLVSMKPGVKSKKPMVLYLGRLKQYKSVKTLLHAAEKVIKELPAVQITIAGDGEEMTSLMNLAKSLNIHNNVNFLGKVTEEQKVSLYQQAWVFVNPSMIEGWGITSVEAQACGTPVVASNVPGLRDSVKNPHTGFLLPYGDHNKFAEHISFLIKNDSVRKQMSQNAAIRAKYFDWEISATKMLSILL